MVVNNVRIELDEVSLEGTLTVPDAPKGIVLFAHGSGSSRHSPRNRMVAGVMQQHHLATLLMDLLMPQEAAADEITGELRFDIPFLTSRLLCAIRWAENHPMVDRLGIGLFGASTGAAAALCAAARTPEVRAVVSRGGRTDMAGADAGKVAVPTLLIVGEADRPVVAWNEETLARLPGVKRLVRIPGATHLFQEPGALEEVATCAARWFAQYLAASPGKGGSP